MSKGSVPSLTEIVHDSPTMSILDQLSNPERRVRIPDSRSVNLPAGFSAIVDHPSMQRLRRIRQLGPTHLVYPGAVHSRFEHSLGVFCAASDYLIALMRLPAFAERVGDDDAASLLAAALLHDVGHYPFAHSLEALHSKAFHTPRHEDLAGDMITGKLGTSHDGPSLRDLIESGLGLSPERVARLVTHGTSSELPAVDQLLASIINSAIDADKLDYLERDSLHMGVPYGRMPDRSRLTANLTVNPTGDRIALSEKGRVAGEIFLFSRYLMFSEAYWHHTVRAASAMIEAALASFIRDVQPSADDLQRLLLASSDDEFLAAVESMSALSSPTRLLLSGLKPNCRSLYKRGLTVSRQRDDTIRHQAYESIYAMERGEVAELAAELRSRVASITGREVAPHELLIDTPPRDKDHLDTVELVFGSGEQREAVPLHEVSRVVKGIGTDFIKVVKKIRVFVHPTVHHELLGSRADVEAELLAVILDKGG